MFSEKGKNGMRHHGLIARVSMLRRIAVITWISLLAAGCGKSEMEKCLTVCGLQKATEGECRDKEACHALCQERCGMGTAGIVDPAPPKSAQDAPPKGAQDSPPKGAQVTKTDAIFVKAGFRLGFQLSMAALGSQDSFAEAQKITKVLRVDLSPPSGNLVEAVLGGEQAKRIQAELGKKGPEKLGAYLLACELMVLASVIEDKGVDRELMLKGIEDDASRAGVSELVAPAVAEFRGGKGDRQSVVALVMKLGQHFEDAVEQTH